MLLAPITRARAWGRDRCWTSAFKGTTKKPPKMPIARSSLRRACLASIATCWLFRFEWLDGTVTEMEELAYQRWEGERIAEETFFYDPAQRVPKKLQE